jgi:hypothetical protein
MFVFGRGEAGGFEATDEVGEASAQGAVDGGADFAQFAFPTGGADRAGDAGFQAEWGLIVGRGRLWWERLLRVRGGCFLWRFGRGWGIVLVVFVEILASVIGDFFNDLPGALMEVAAAGVAFGDVEGAQQERGGFVLDGAVGDGVHDFHEGVLDGLAVFEDEHGSDAGVDGQGNAAHDAFVEVAEVFAFEGGGFAGVSGDADVGAAGSGLQGHGSSLSVSFVSGAGGPAPGEQRFFGKLCC